jgi:FkbM family methyltransferase
MNEETAKHILERLDRIERKIGEVRQLVGPFGVPFPNNEILVQTLYGTKYFVDANDLVMAPQLVVYRQWESDISAFFLNSVTSDTVFLDIGASFGYFTCLVGSRIGMAGSGAVIAVEPNPRMFDLLTRNIKINWSMAKIETHACAITPDGMSIDLMIPTNAAANASIRTETNREIGGPYSLLHVRGATVDHIVADRNVNLVKIDVEGHELHVLNGGAKTFGEASNIHVVIEWALSQMSHAQVNPNAVLDKIEEFGLTTYRLPHSIHLSDEALAPFRLSREELMATAYANVYLRKIR